jgi:hypothetical protein
MHVRVRVVTLALAASLVDIARSVIEHAQHWDETCPTTLQSIYTRHTRESARHTDCSDVCAFLATASFRTDRC